MFKYVNDILRWMLLGPPILEAAMRSKFTIFLDEQLHHLEAGLEDAGCKVIMMEKGMSDPKIMKMASGWCILTRNSKDFRNYAVKYDFDVISIETIKFQDTDPTMHNQTVRKVINAVRKSGLATRKGNFFLTVFDDGKFLLEELAI